ncbi:hypothetical protein [Blastococcus sp. SYSU DS0533]
MESVGIDGRLFFQECATIVWDQGRGAYDFNPALDGHPAVYRVFVQPNAFYVGEARNLADRFRRHLTEDGSEVLAALHQARAAGVPDSDLGRVEIVSMTATASELFENDDYSNLEFRPITRTLPADAVYTRLAVEGMALAVSVEMWPAGRCLNRLTRNGEGLRYVR